MSTTEPKPTAAAVPGTDHGDPAGGAPDRAALSGTGVPTRPIFATRRTREVHHRSSHGALGRLRGPAA